MLNLKTQAAASNGKAAVLLGVIDGYGLVVVRYAPKSIGSWENRAEFERLCDISAAKLGYRRDRRCCTGWRKLPTKDSKMYQGIREEIRELVQKRIKMALLLCNGNKSAAADMLGLSSYQTLTNWMIKYGVENDK